MLRFLFLLGFLLNFMVVIMQDTQEDMNIEEEEVAGSMQSSPCRSPNSIPKWKRMALRKKIPSVTKCEDICGKTKKCQYYSYNKKSKACGLYTVQMAKNKVFISGKMNCKTTSPPPPPPVTPPPVGDCKCGLAQRATKILGGVETEVNEYPWQVGLLYENNINPSCGGSLISDQWVLTAAHCIILPPNNFDASYIITVMLGEHNWLNPDDADVVKRKLSQRATVLPGYVGLYNDYALLKLEAPIDFTQYNNIRPICLPTNPTEDYADSNATATGWGVVDKYVNGTLSPFLQELEVKVLSNAECEGMIGGPVMPSHMCAGGQVAGESTCAGDSGGPLVTSGDGDGVTPGQNYELIGVVSGGSVNCSLPLPVFYSRVTNVLKWIQDTTSGLNTCPRT